MQNKTIEEITRDFETFHEWFMEQNESRQIAIWNSYCYDVNNERQVYDMYELEELFTGQDLLTFANTIARSTDEDSDFFRTDKDYFTIDAYGHLTSFYSPFVWNGENHFGIYGQAEIWDLWYNVKNGYTNEAYNEIEFLLNI